jgi:predicted transcriptional regulator of viral defense system
VVLNRRVRAQERYPVVDLAADGDALDEVTGSRRRTRAALQALVRTGRLRPLRRGTYVISEPTGSPVVGVMRLIELVSDKPYLVTAGRALAELGLSDQHFFVVVVLSPRRQASWSWQGDRVRYARVSPNRVWGAKPRSRPAVAGPARALLDSLAHPAWGVTLAQTAQALSAALRRGMVSGESLAASAARYGNDSLARRLGLLVQLLAGDQEAAPLRSVIGTSRTSVPLLPGGPTDGAVDRRWRVRANVDVDALLERTA